MKCSYDIVKSWTILRLNNKLDFSTALRINIFLLFTSSAIKCDAAENSEHGILNSR
ncbi:hypothetical protein BH18THE2_BH18THE2_38860 [soil metagenome]